MTRAERFLPALVVAWCALLGASVVAVAPAAFGLPS